MSTATMMAKGNRGYLITDTAGIDGDGVVCAWVNKVITIPHKRLAITTRGACAALPAFATDLMERFTSFDDILENGVGFIEEMHDRYMMNWNDLAGMPEFDLALLGWSDRDEQFRAAAISSIDNPGLPAFTFLRTDVIFAPSPPHDEMIEAGLLRDGSIPSTLDPVSVLKGILNLQRRMSVPIGGRAESDSVYSVGGQAVFTELTPQGINQRIVHTWADRIGEPIDPLRDADAVMSEAERRAADKRERKRLARAA